MPCFDFRIENTERESALKLPFDSDNAACLTKKFSNGFRVVVPDGGKKFRVKKQQLLQL